ncbi:MAG: carbohydrate binding domain-containing protein, partial [Candidatus Uhrbacteria bacterium]|nr:carbohydrate binding domain-containing protein [Candidatus Uhrbacteria bacterium]
MAQRLKRMIAAIGLLFVFALPMVIVPSVAYAQTQSTTVVDGPRVLQWIGQLWDKYLKDALIQGAATVLINTMTYAADRLAYDAAVYISSGGDGEDPLFDNSSVGEYFSNYGASVAGEAIGQIDDTGLLGNFKLCDPSASITIAFKFGLQSAFDREEPECDIKQMGANWEGFLADVSSTLSSGEKRTSLVLSQLSDMYNPQTNDFSAGIQLTSSVLSQAQQQRFLEAQKHLLVDGFKDKTDFLTGKVETPAKLLQDNLADNMKKPEKTRESVGTVILGSSEEILLQMGLHAGSVFANTLISKGMQRLYDGLFSNLDDVNIDPFNEIGYSSSNAESARLSFSSFLAAAPLQITNYSILKEFSSCPSVGRGLYHCVADALLVSGIARAESGSALTIAEALEEGILNANWPLIQSSDEARDQDAYCYSYGYCHSNLVKMRKARIISIGWELAAESAYNDEGNPTTLGEVVEGFNNCSSSGQPTEQYPWCHLIDPNWVLKYPDTQCRAQVYGQLTSNPSSDQRKEECVDMPSCIDENDDGTCDGGYGYCVREENVWRFRGEECPDYYATCTTYENTDGDDVAYLSNTIDSGVCTEDSAGCLWYSTVKDESSGTLDWPVVDDVVTSDADDSTYAERIYFTAAVETCDAEDAGCRELVRRDDDLSLNMLTNPSFEDDEDGDGMPDGWFVGLNSDATSYLPEYDTEGNYALNGSAAISPGDSSNTGAISQTGIVLRQATTYTLSFYARQTATSADDVSAFLVIDENRDNDGDGNLDDMDITGTEVSGDCDTTYTDLFGASGNTDGYAIEDVTPEDTGFDRYSCTFAVPTLDDASMDVLGSLIILETAAYIDSMQLEQDAEASDFHEGYSDSTLSLAYVKVPPTYLGCTGEDGDPEACDDFAAVCEEQDVGCSEYTPTNGDPAVIGVANALDECPSSCVGYDTFKQEPTLYEPEGDFPVYFIPDSAEECDEEAVGCDEFTNESTEALEYFTYLRACVTDTQATANISGDNAAVFYTWEGSDLDGYQLLTWELLESDLGATTFTYPSGESDTNPGTAPCTNWDTSTEGIACDDDDDGDASVDGDPIDVSEDCDQHSDVLTNPDCREFYDAEGIIHYREWSATVTVDDACVTYRKTEVVGDSLTDRDANCTGSGGYFDTTSGECRYYGFADESNTCSESDSGCREYTGGRSRNSRLAFVEYFEDDTLTQWESNSVDNVTLSNESVATDGHSLASEGETVWTYVAVESSCTADAGCAGTEGTLGGTCTVAYGETTCGTLDGQVFDGKTYTLSFWAKGTGNIDVGFDVGASASSVTSSTVDYFFDQDIALEEGWNEYSLGPLSIDNADFGDGTVLAIIPAPGITFYIDNVVLREGEDNITVIKDSWVTPAECDETPEGADSAQYYLGCAEYTDQDGDTAYLKSFSSLCSEAQVGCESFFMTQESDATQAQVFNAICSNDPDGDGTSTIALTATDCYYGTATGAFDTESRYLCTVGVGNTQCAFDLDFYVPAANLPDHMRYEASTQVVPADQEVFLVVDSEVECSSSVIGCEEVGLPTFSQDHSAVDSWTSSYFINDPDEYADTLCTSDELFCDAWQEGSGDMAYFKNPQDQTCEYVADVTIGGTTYDGWFKTGTTELCDPAYVIGGDFGGIQRNGDDGYADWVGSCEEKYDGCSEFQDLTDLTQQEVYTDADGESYYYLDNDNLDENTLPSSQKCNDQVGQKDGCGLFNDAGEPSKDYATSPSYILSIHADVLLSQAPNSLVDPVDCESGSDASTFEGVDLCETRCAYVEGDLYDLSNSSSTDRVYDGSCYEDDDCRPLLSEVGETVDGSCVSASSSRLENDANRI